jgi:hypothetical protein
MNLDIDFIQPAELTGYVREALADFEINRFRLNRYLPNRMVDDIEARFVSGGEGLTNAATFRAYDAESPVGSRPGLQRTTLELPPISRKLRLSEYDRLRQRVNGDVFVQDGLFTDAQRLTREIAARMELARGDALVNGSVTLNENGLIVTASFGRASGNSVVPGTVWTDSVNADPINDLVAWTQAYEDLMGELPASALMNRTTFMLLLRAQKLRFFASNLVGSPTIITPDILNNVLQSYNLPSIDVYHAAVRVNGSTTRIIPDGKVVLLPEPVQDPNDYEGTQLGATMWGTTAEALEPEFNLVEGDLPGVTAGVYSTDDPVALWTKAAGIGFPILANPNLSLTATVN